MIAWLRRGAPFPPIETALADPNGLLAASADVSAQRLLDAYRRGIFPWYNAGQPVLWWTPDPRTVLFIDEFRMARSLRQRVKQRRWEIRVDSAFGAVIEACATVPRRGQAGTWITSAIAEAYTELHKRGYAHSVESWREGKLAGGLYGVAIGRMFYGESMFAWETDASKVALVHLVGMLRTRGFPMIDCQQDTAHLASFGARPVSRSVFAERVAALVHSTAPAAPWVPVPDSGVLA
jgi:leucyl/phenylalanyl-tRNA---protein transferase